MSEIKRKLATIQRIDKVLPIEGADNIVKITFKSIGWSCVTNKSSNPYEGKQVVYLEVDSMLPSTNPVFAFMEPYHYRVKTVKLRGTISQGLAIPLDDFPELTLPPGQSDKIIQGMMDITVQPIWIDGCDVTDLLGVTKYEGPADAQIGGDTKGPFPGFIEKTDEERCANFSRFEDLLTAHEFDVTIKCDGTSGTFYLFNVTDDPQSGEFGVCSRNQELKDSEGNIFWKMARKYNLEERLRGMGRNLSIQGEVVGPGIQSNRLGLTENKLLVFTIQDLDRSKRLSNEQIANVLDRMNEFAEGANLEMVPRILNVPPLKTLADVVALSEGTNLINDRPREGIVLRARDDPSISMKQISTKYLLKFDL